MNDGLRFANPSYELIRLTVLRPGFDISGSFGQDAEEHGFQRYRRLDGQQVASGIAQLCDGGR